MAHVGVDLYHGDWSAAVGDGFGTVGGFFDDEYGREAAEGFGRRLYGYVGRHVYKKNLVHCASHYAYRAPARVAGTWMGDRFGRNFLW